MKTRDLFVLSILMILLSIGSLAKDFGLEKADLVYSISSDGSIAVTESITYRLSGCFNELFIQKPQYFLFEGQSYDFDYINPSGHCVGADCVFVVVPAAESISGENELVLRLQSNNCDSSVTAEFSYGIKQLIVAKDVAQFYYKLWGDKTDKQVPLTVTVNLPGDVNEAEYFIHPWGLSATSSESGKSITIKSSQPSNTFLEINLLMPKQWFNSGTGNYYLSNRTREEILDAEDKDKKNYEYIKSIIEPLIIFLSAVTFLSPIALFLLVHLFFGREHRIEDLGYTKEAYERDPPSKALPEESAYFLEGKYSDRSFVAGIMNLIYKKYLDIDERDKDVFILIKKPGDDSLKMHQRKLLEIIESKAKDGELNFKVFSKPGYDSGLAKKYEEWKKALDKEAGINRFLERKGTAVYGVLVFIALAAFFAVASIISAVFRTELVGALFFSVFSGFFSGIILIIYAAFKPALLGRWTKEGRVLNMKWVNFRKYLEDFSYLKEHPPESVKLWDYFMAYAIAFGVAEKTLEAMKTSISTEEMRSSGLRSPLLLTHPVFYNYHAASHISSAAQSSHSSGGGGFGGSGGGGGGGGAGAR